MNRICTCCLLFFLTVTQTLLGRYDCDCTVLRAEYLYFKPTFDQSAYVISSSESRSATDIYPDGTRHFNTPRHHSAFRLEGIYELSQCTEIDARFTYFNAGDSDATSGPFLFDVIGFPGDGAQGPEDISYSGTAKIHDHFKYLAADATFNRLTIAGCPENLSFLFGLHYAYIRLKDHFSSTGFFIDDEEPFTVSNHLTRHSQFWGIGPEFGIDYRYFFPSCCCNRLLSLGINGRIGVLCSHTDVLFHYNTFRTNPARVNLSNDPIWRVTPFADARVNLACHFSYCCIAATIEIGYELIQYCNCIDCITGLDVAFAGNSIDLFSNFNLQGPYIAIAIAF